MSDVAFNVAMSFYGLLLSVFFLATLGSTLNQTRLVHLSDGNYEVQRCYFYRHFDCHELHRTPDVVEATKVYEDWIKPAPPKPAVIEQIKP